MIIANHLEIFKNLNFGMYLIFLLKIIINKIVVEIYNFYMISNTIHINDEKSQFPMSKIWGPDVLTILHIEVIIS